ncbi:MAG TPA: hypothetical protein VGP89_07300, partial [Candidatus Angelobacter sp.]|nr:hypothetical protein [Candidatus Angelobacter sp.]
KPTTVPYAKFGDPQSLNLYSYVENGPINRIDADGHTYASWNGFNADKSGSTGHTDLDNEVDFEAEHDAAGHEWVLAANEAMQRQQQQQAQQQQNQSAPSQDIQSNVRKQADAYGIPQPIALATAAQESNFDVTLRGARAKLACSR